MHKTLRGNATVPVIVGVVVVLAVAFGLYLLGASHSGPSSQDVQANCSGLSGQDLTDCTDHLGASGSGQILYTPSVKGGIIDETGMETFSRSGTIALGANQGYWKNTTGRTVYARNATMGWENDTSTTTLKFNVGTSTASTFSNDFARPVAAGARLLIDGAIRATSTSPGDSFAISTTTSTGYGEIAVPNNAYLVFQAQETFGCKADAACGTATSTHRYPRTLLWSFQGRFKP